MKTVEVTEAGHIGRILITLDTVLSFLVEDGDMAGKVLALRV